MLRELTREDWMSMLGIPETAAPRALLLWGTRNLKTRYAAMRPRFDRVLEVGGPNGLVEDVLIGRLSAGGICVGYASVYGAPMASEIVHLFGVLGARLVIQIGTCGGLVAGLKAGDLFAVEQAYCGEGASQYYKHKGKTARATVTFSDIPADDRRNISIAHGSIYTTSALFAEGRDDIERWAQRGFAAVDMETAATFAVAEHFDMDRGSLLAVFDTPGGDDHILTTDMQKDARRAAAQDAMVDIAVAAITNHVKTSGEQPGRDDAADRTAHP